ncbi:MAG: exodeoxyribonuclease VII small subunit [Rudaea sp.]|uniref:exodeoxyribonuclease VII small subunit n=1 Tax=Rudaea sp. TaxID=2136325 RepID=UPI0039E4CA2C
MPQTAAREDENESNKIAEFEASLDELEKLVARMEGGEMSLDESLQSFERGIALYRSCQSALDEAQLRVRLLRDPVAADTAEDFDPQTP